MAKVVSNGRFLCLLLHIVHVCHPLSTTSAASRPNARATLHTYPLILFSTLISIHGMLSFTRIASVSPTSMDTFVFDSPVRKRKQHIEARSFCLEIYVYDVRGVK